MYVLSEPCLAAYLAVAGVLSVLTWYFLLG